MYQNSIILASCSAFCGCHGHRRTLASTCPYNAASVVLSDELKAELLLNPAAIAGSDSSGQGDACSTPRRLGELARMTNTEIAHSLGLKASIAITQLRSHCYLARCLLLLPDEVITLKVEINTHLEAGSIEVKDIPLRNAVPRNRVSNDFMP